MDLLLFRLINNLSMKNDLLDSVAILLSKYGIILMIICIICLTLSKQKRLIGLYGILALAISLGVNRLLKMSFDRPRPFMEHTVNLVIERAPSPSFPSDQALIAGVFLVVIWLVSKKLAAIAFIYSFAVILSRVYVGHHYPSDVLTGYMLGMLLTVIVFFVVKRIKKAPSPKLTVDV